MKRLAKSSEKSCAALEPYLAGQLTEAQRADFAAHLESCALCQRKVTLWRSIETTLNDFPISQGQRLTVPDQAAALIQRAASLETPSSGVSKWRPAIALTMIILCIGGAGLYLFRDKQKEFASHSKVTHVKVLYSQGLSISPPRSLDELLFTDVFQQQQELSVKQGGRGLIAVEKDRLALGGNSRADILLLKHRLKRIKIRKGTITANVAKRSVDEQLVIIAGAYKATVVGTSFQIRYIPPNEFWIAVAGGTVIAEDQTGTKHRVEAEEVLYLNRKTGAVRKKLQDSQRQVLLQELVVPVKKVGEGIHPKASATSSMPLSEKNIEDSRTEKKPSKGIEKREKHLQELENKILSGDFVEAEQALLRCLKKKPRAARLWSLLAECYNGEGEYQKAIKAHMKVIQYSTPRAANRARFKAAVILQEKLGDHYRAKILLEAYLRARAATRVLEAEAMVRLARSLIKLGDARQAKRLLETVISQHRSTSSAMTARTLLKSLLKQ